MEYVVVGICIVAVVAIVALLTYNRGQRVSSPEGEDKFDKDSGTIIQSKPANYLSQIKSSMNLLFRWKCSLQKKYRARVGW